MLSQEEKENLEHVSTTVQEADQHHLMPCQVHFCVSDASFVSCKTLHVKFWIILMLYSQTMSCILVLLNVSKAEEKERRLASTIESMQASHMLQNTTLRSRFGQSVSVTKKSETIAYFATPVLNPPRLIDFAGRQRETGETTWNSQARGQGPWVTTKKHVVLNQSWRCCLISESKKSARIFLSLSFHFQQRCALQDLGNWSMVFVFYDYCTIFVQSVTFL